MLGLLIGDATTDVAFQTLYNNKFANNVKAQNFKMPIQSEIERPGLGENLEICYNSNTILYHTCPITNLLITIIEHKDSDNNESKVMNLTLAEFTDIKLLLFIKVSRNFLNRKSCHWPAFSTDFTSIFLA